jgi:hypothetical protein
LAAPTGGPSLGLAAAINVSTNVALIAGGIVPAGPIALDALFKSNATGELMAWSRAVPDWQDRIRNGRSLVPDLPLDKIAAKRAVVTIASPREGAAADRRMTDCEFSIFRGGRPYLSPRWFNRG